MTDAAVTPATKIHPWEALGLGRAPFRCLGVERRVGPIRQYDANGEPTGLECGAPGQPMGTCDACGMGIADCYLIRSADRKNFIVGCDCAMKVYRDDGGPLERDVRRHKLTLDHTKDDARIAAAVKLLDRPEVMAALDTDAVREAFANKNGWFGWAKKRSVSEWCVWTLTLSHGVGRAGKIRAARVVERAAALVGA